MRLNSTADVRCVDASGFSGRVVTFLVSLSAASRSAWTPACWESAVKLINILCELVGRHSPGGATPRYPGAGGPASWVAVVASSYCGFEAAPDVIVVRPFDHHCTPPSYLFTSLLCSTGWVKERSQVK